MKKEKMFKKLLSEYCNVAPQDMKNDMRLIEDLGLSSFDLMSFLGDMEDNFDFDLNLDNIANITTIGEALKLVVESDKEA